jgi:molybdopterin synthase sulfur carrier subunit
MAVKVKIPTPLRGLTNNQDTVDADGAATVSEVVQNLERNYPGMRERLLDDQGELRRFVNIYVNGEDIRFMDNLATAIKPGDEVSIVPAVAGGR